MKNIYKNLYSKKCHLKLKKDERLTIMKNMVSLKPGDNILDIGCYDCTFLSFFKGKNINLYGIEASQYACQKCREKGVKVKNFYFNGQKQIPFKDNFFDFIIAGEIIEHLYEIDFFLEEIYRLLKKGGFLVLSTPNLASFGRRLLLLFGLNPIIEVSCQEKLSCGHIRYFVKDSLFKLLGKHKFKITKFKSDIVNFDKNGNCYSRFLARLFPTLGKSLIVKCQKL